MKIRSFYKSLRFQLIMISLVLLVFIISAIHFSNNLTLLVLFLVCAILLIIILNIWFIQRIIKPIETLTDSAKNIASGTYGIQCENTSNNELGMLTEEINVMSLKIAENDVTKNEFISQVSHELRTPLTAITGWSETLAYDPAISGDSLRGLKIIEKEASRLTGMVEELLEFTRIQSGRFNLRIELIDITAELEDALFTYGELLKSAGIIINYSTPDFEIPLIPGDSERLKQVFLNILDNAAKHGKEGNSIDVFLSHDDKYVDIMIRDYGKGIPENELSHVKEKFFKGSSKDRGNGIGLAVCDEIVTRHGGHLKITNADGGGCLVIIRLPLSNNM